MVRLQAVTSATDLQALEPEWDDLLALSSADPLFLSWDYLQCWWATFGADFQLHVLVARNEEGKLLGIAPLMTGPGHRSLRRFVRHLAFIGQLCESLPEYCDFILRPGAEKEVMESFYAHITGDFASEWDVLYFPLIRTDSPALQLLRGLFAGDGIEPKTVFSQTAHFVTLTGTWEDYLRTRSSNFRDKLRKSSKRLSRAHDVSLVGAGPGLALEEAMPRLKELIQDRWETQAEAFSTPRFDEFHHRLAQRFEATGRLALWFLLVDGQTVAAQYDFVDPVRKRVYGFQSGWKQELARLSIGKVLQARTLQHYFALGLNEYDFMSGHGEYKASWCNGERQVCDLEIPNPGSLRGQVFGLARRIREARSSLLGGDKAA